ncbi:MAG: Fic family protein, partial [Spirochaetales bacterium]|nr:Fic family protein [Spirochaetales bacterium]
MDIAALRKRDADLYARLPAFMLKGEHLVLANAMFHPGRLMNELNAMNFIIDHESEPFCLKTICDIYAALTEGTEFEGKSFKKRNVFVSDKNRKYLFVTAAAEDTPDEIERICKDFSHLDNPRDENLDDMLRFILMLMLIHPFEDGNGRFASVVLQ